MKGLIIPNLSRESSIGCAVDVAAALRRCGVVPVIPLELKKYFLGLDVTFFRREKAFKSCDFLVSIGGDGTILHAAKEAVLHNLPVLGINTGRMGFLTSIEKEELSYVEKFIAGDYTTEERKLIEVQIGEQSVLAVNEVVLARGQYARIIDIEVCINGVPLHTVRGDGVILSSPTGSTAYALSAGGPVVDPDISSLGITAICPHSLFNRTILVSEKNQISLQPKDLEAGDELTLSADGDPGIRITPNMIITAKLSQKSLKLIRFKDKGFYQALGQKLMWGGGLA